MKKIHMVQEKSRKQIVGLGMIFVEHTKIIDKACHNEFCIIAMVQQIPEGLLGSSKLWESGLGLSLSLCKVKLTWLYTNTTRMPPCLHMFSRTEMRSCQSETDRGEN